MKLETLEQNIGYTFTNKTLLSQALTHRSFSDQNNERLEFMGDALLDFLVAELLYNLYPDLKEGDLTKCRSALVNGEMLAEIAISMQFYDFIIVEASQRRDSSHMLPSVLATVFEALIGAIYLDGGFEACRKIIGIWYQDHIKTVIDDVKTFNPKSTLQEWAQAKHKKLPEYTIVKTAGEPHKRSYIVACSIEGIDFITQATASTRRRAEQQAAWKLLQYIYENDSSNK